MHNNACFWSRLAENSKTCTLFHIAASDRGLPPRLMEVHDGAMELRDRGQCRIRSFAVRRMPDARQDGHIHGAVAFVLRELDLAQGAVLIGRALDYRNGHADIGEIVGNIPAAEFCVEPRTVPAMEGVVDILVPAREFGAEVRGLIRD